MAGQHNMAPGRLSSMGLKATTQLSLSLCLVTQRTQQLLQLRHGSCGTRAYPHCSSSCCQTQPCQPWRTC